MTTLSDLGHDERTARGVLSFVATPSDTTTGQLLDRLGTVELLRLVDAKDALPGLDKVASAVWRERFRAAPLADKVAVQMAAAERVGLVVLIPGDADWPRALDDLGDRRPYALWTRGRTELVAGGLVSRVTLTGARASTAYGEFVAADLARDLTTTGHVIVAGAAYGIEGAAHKAALASHGTTIAVLPGGLDRPYPVGHASLLEQVGASGLLLSEAAPGSVPTRQSFIDRARIIAALTAATIVVEAGSRSGSMRVAAEAAQLDRVVGAVPGPITSATSYGPHTLLQGERAHLVTCADDITMLIRNDAATRRDTRLGHEAPALAAPRTASVAHRAM